METVRGSTTVSSVEFAPQRQLLPEHEFSDFTVFLRYAFSADKLKTSNPHLMIRCPFSKGMLS
jgi:hypothetical protein